MKKLLSLVLLISLSACGQFRGPAGERGAEGPQGIQGETGAPGADAILEAIALCPEIPGDFPEYLLRTSTGLFAVYYDHVNKKSFMAMLMPGNYMSTDGRNCTFSVGADGSVSH